jgi:hypothetical protein
MRAHLALNVENLNESKEFVARLFDAIPFAEGPDHARFILSQPSWNLMLEKSDQRSSVHHLGIEVETQEEVAQWAERLSQLSIRHRYVRKADCCHAIQDQVSFTDPEGNQWEVFYLHPAGPQTRTS